MQYGWYYQSPQNNTIISHTPPQYDIAPFSVIDLPCTSISLSAEPRNVWFNVTVQENQQYRRLLR